MTFNQAVIVYAVCWWLLFLMALPVGVKPLEDPKPGENPGAPARPRLFRKALIVSVLAVLITCAIDLLLHSGIVSFHS